MKNSTINLEALAPLAEAEREHREKWEAYREAVTALRAVVDSIAERQRNDADKITGMLAELEAEEQKLRQTTREQAEARALCRITGQEPPRNDFSAGARLAAIPEEKAALEALRGRRRITDQEREEYEAALEAAQAAADEGRRAAKRRHDELEAVFTLVSAARGGFEAIPNPFDLSDIIERVYHLNTPETDEDEGAGYETPYGVLRGGRRA